MAMLLQCHRKLIYLVGLHDPRNFDFGYLKKKPQMVAKLNMIPSYMVLCKFNLSKHSQGILIFVHIMSY